MTLAEMYALVEKAESEDKHMGISPRLMRKLLAVAVEANESVGATLLHDWRPLELALAALEDD